MSSIFNGTPITANTSSQTTTQTPQWLRDAIYNQVQTVQNTAALPFQQYGGALTAGPTANQQAAWSNAGYNPGAGAANSAISGLQALAGQPVGQAGDAAAASFAEALKKGGLEAAQPYMNTAAQGASSELSKYMNPYIDSVSNRIAQLGARNLSENLLPAVSDQFVNAGQFGGSRMGEFGARALRDTNESILGQQASALQSGFNTAVDASTADQNRQVQLAQLAEQAAAREQQAKISAAQQQFDNSQAERNSTSNILQQLLQGGTTLQGMSQAQRQEMAGYGADQRAINQAGLDAQYQQYLRSQAYPQQQTNYLTEQLGALSGLVPNVQVTNSVAPTGVNPSGASQITGGLAALLGLLGR